MSKMRFSILKTPSIDHAVLFDTDAGLRLAVVAMHTDSKRGVVFERIGFDLQKLRDLESIYRITHAQTSSQIDAVNACAEYLRQLAIEMNGVEPSDFVLPETAGLIH